MVVGHRHTVSASAVSIRWTTVQRGNVVNTVSLTGTLTPAHEATITTSGTLTSVSVQVGDKVKKGQVIAHVDDTDYENQLQQAKAQLAEAEAKLAQSEEVTTTTNSRGQTQTQQPDANAVAEAQANVDAAQASVDQIEDEIAACTLKSPISGTVLQVASVNGGETSNSSSSSASSNSSSNSSVGSGNTVAVIANLSSDEFLVSANVAQADIGQLKKGQSATISLGTGGPVLTGKVDTIGYQPQTENGVTLYPVTIKVNAPDNQNVQLLPGESVSVNVTVQSRSNVLTVPTAAIVSQRGQTGVYVQASQNNGAESSGTTASANEGSGFSGTRIPEGLTFVPVQVGLYGGNTVEIRSGLKQGERVAIVTVASSTAGQNQSSTNAGGLRSFVGGYGGRFSGGAMEGYGGSGATGFSFRGNFGQGSSREPVSSGGLGGGTSTGFGAYSGGNGGYGTGGGGH